MAKSPLIPTKSGSRSPSELFLAVRRNYFVSNTRPRGSHLSWECMRWHSQAQPGVRVSEAERQKMQIFPPNSLVRLKSAGRCVLTGIFQHYLSVHVSIRGQTISSGHTAIAVKKHKADNGSKRGGQRTAPRRHSHCFAGR